VLADGALCARERVPADEHPTLVTSLAWEGDAQFRGKKINAGKNREREEMKKMKVKGNA
jgi:hypothetical protein